MRDKVGNVIRWQVAWTFQLLQPKDGRVVAAAVDEAGNRETLTHVVLVKD